MSASLFPFDRVESTPALDADAMPSPLMQPLVTREGKDGSQ
jgi:hypothetical protein